MNFRNWNNSPPNKQIRPNFNRNNGGYNCPPPPMPPAHMYNPNQYADHPFIPEFNDFNCGPTRLTTGELNLRASGMLVELSGRITQKRTTRFMTLRDQCGTIQIVAPMEELRMEARFNAIPIDSHIVVVGHVVCRPRVAVNGAHDNGAIEVHVRDILNVRKPPTPQPPKNGAALNTTQKRSFCTSSGIPGTAVPTSVTSGGGVAGPEVINRGVTAAEHRKTRGQKKVTAAFQNRKRTCGELRAAHIGEIVELIGWIDEGKKNGRFVQLRDGHGSVQVVIDLSNLPLRDTFAQLTESDVVRVKGIVVGRPETNRNGASETGEVEISVWDCTPVEGMESGAVASTNKHRFSHLLSNRTHSCSSLNQNLIGKKVKLSGWLEMVKMRKFITLRDDTGSVQVLVPPGMIDAVNADAVPLESLIEVEGSLMTRPEKFGDRATATGCFEVILGKFKVLKENVDGSTKVTVNSICNNNESVQGGHESTVNKEQIPANHNLFTTRTHTCGELRNEHAGQQVTLCGWLEFERMKKFLTLRDGYGSIQVLVPPAMTNEVNVDAVPFESIIEIEGTVVSRPDKLENTAMVTGGVEVMLSKFRVLNPSRKNLPVEVRNFNRAKETLRLENRYVDLRFSDMQRNLRTRSQVLMKMREYLVNDCGFVEVETPTLFRRTPGGAQEFIVPTQKPGHFYSLVQSPQQFKQMLMAGAIDRYFQIARCYRDEATRKDRQPEFTQLDIELSFTDREKIMAMVEQIVQRCWPGISGEVHLPFARMTYSEAMAKYGSDKPDLRYDMSFRDVSLILQLHETLPAQYEDFAAYAIVLKDPYSGFPTSLKNSIAQLVKNATKSRLFVSKIKEPTVLAWTESSIANALTNVVTKSLAASLNLESNDLLFLSLGKRGQAQELLGRVRTAVMESLEEREVVPKRKNSDLKFLWVVDFPMFTRNEETGKLESTHHPFTAAHKEDEQRLAGKERLEEVRSLAYDLVLNGQEIGGGSIRIHDGKMQKFVLEEILDIPYEHLGHLIDALESGCPPHGGIALGVDRLLQIMCDTNSIRDVIAFPKGMDGKDHLSKAPVELAKEELELYHIQVEEGKGGEEVKDVEMKG